MKLPSGFLRLLILSLMIVGSFALVGCDSDSSDPVSSAPAMSASEISLQNSHTRTALIDSQNLGVSSTAVLQNRGIVVQGVGKVTMEPQLALVSLGVETFASSVNSARQQAAKSVASIIETLKSLGLEENSDISTSQFHIQPEYAWEAKAGRMEQRVLKGYTVTNTLDIKVSAIDMLGQLIDETVTAGGDASRVNSVRFVVEDSAAQEEAARIAAISDAIEKADTLAREFGVIRGKLRYATELSGSTGVQSYGGMDMRMMEASVPTPILAGQSEVKIAIQAVFEIE